MGKYLMFAICFCACLSLDAQVAINITGAKADSSSILDMSSSTRGVLVPRMTTIQRNLIAMPATGLIVYDTDKESYYYYVNNAQGWRSVRTALRLADTDADTYVEVEQSDDEDLIRLTLEGVEYFVLHPGRMEILNSGESISIGNGAGANDDFTLNRNVFIGSYAGSANTSGSDNTSIGYSALSANQEMAANTAVGAFSQLLGSAGEGNTSLGAHALRANVSGGNNVAVGVNALYNSDGRDNLVAVGDYALYNNSIGSSGSVEASENTALGSKTLFSNTTGYGNTAVGNSALFGNVNGDMNTALGALALYSNQAGGMNTAIGRNALFLNLLGGANTAVGVQSLFSNIIGYSNTAFGVDALYSNLSGNANVAVGFSALYSNSDRSNNIAIGDSALYFNGSEAAGAEDATWNTGVGSNALYLNTSGNSNTAIGNSALDQNISGSFRTGIGAFSNAFGEDLSNNTAIGYGANCTASNQVMIGNAAVDDIGGFSDWSNMSDGRFKTNVRTDVPGLEFIRRLTPVTYTLDLHALDRFYADQYSEDIRRSSNYYDRESDIQSGFIAQDVEATAKQLGYEFSGVDAPEGPQDIYGLRYGQFVVPLVKAVQQLDEANAQLREENEALRREIEQLNQQQAEFNNKLNALSVLLPDQQER